METFLERLLLELAAILVQVAILRIVHWLRARPATLPGLVAAA